MRVELIAIGNELLLGDSTDTNSAWISRRLAEIGVTVVRHTTVSDAVEDMALALATGIARADVVLTTGGLGPTQDDLTRNALASVADVALVRDDAMAQEIDAYFASRGRSMPTSNLQQADLPEGAWWLSRVGSAPGLALEVPIDGRVATVMCMPGVPREMQVMLINDVVPHLVQQASLATTVSRVVRTSGLSESSIADHLAELVRAVEADGGPTIAFLASRGETRVKVTATAADRRAALAQVDPVIEQVVDLLGRGVVGLDDQAVEHAIGRLLSDRGLTVAVAESITGGGVGARLVSVPGASVWFRGGLIAYATDTKTLLAGVPAVLLEGDGSVTAAVAEALAQGAAGQLEADFGLAIVGVAGPDPVGDAPVGLVRVAVARPDGLVVAREVSVSGRARIDVQEFGVSAALSLLHEVLRDLG